jgi:hypothetical protein
VKVTVELILYRLNHFGMAVTYLADAYTRNEIEISASVRRVKVRTFGALDGQHKRRSRGLGEVCEKRFATEIQGVDFCEIYKKANGHV